MIEMIHQLLTHWGRVTHKCIRKLTTTGLDNGLSPGRRQAINSTNVGILPIGPLGTNFSETLIEMYQFLFTKMHLKMSYGKMAAILSRLNISHKVCTLLRCLDEDEFLVDSCDLFTDNPRVASCILQSLCSLSGRTSYRKVLWSLEATKLGFRLFQSL